MSFTIKGRLVDIHQNTIYPAKVLVEKERIISITPLDHLESEDDHYILPGFIDAHVHIESSMLTPAEFARIAVIHGTVSTVSDPHEIANVCGLKGINFMIENGKTVPFKFNFGAPSCVPATSFETSGGSLDSNDIDHLLKHHDILYMAEMMNFPGVLNKDPEVMKKIAFAKKHNKPVDGHAPGIKGLDAKNYVNAGISTDHECFSKEEALEKLSMGMKIIIREGSAAKNFEALIDLLNEYPEYIMFCSDDKHPDSLVEGHINALCSRAVSKGIDLFKVLKAACWNPVKHYKLNVGLLRPNDYADFILVKDLQNFNVIQTYINGHVVADNGKTLIKKNKKHIVINNFRSRKMEVRDFQVPFKGEKEITVIEALDGQLITNKLSIAPVVENHLIVTDTDNDILKLVVINRYKNAPVAKGFIKNFGIKCGAIASSVAHDSHNIVAVGTDDKNLCKAVNLIMENKGGISWVKTGESPENIKFLPLPVAGLMSAEDGFKVAEDYAAMNLEVKKSGSSLSAPYMTLSFMALLVIPHIKISDYGLFDSDNFKLMDA